MTQILQPPPGQPAPVPTVTSTPDATGQIRAAEPPPPPSAAAPQITEHPYALAMTQLQDVKGDAAVLLHTAARLITDEMDRLRAQSTQERQTIAQLQERAHEAELKSTALTERSRDETTQRHFRDAVLALGGVLAGVGFGSWQQTGNYFGTSIFVVGILLILATALFVRTARDSTR